MTKMKKKLLFVISGLDAGGAEKSLVNLLSSIDGSRFSVDLFMFCHEGLFVSQIPNWVQVLPKNVILIDFQKSLFSSLFIFLKQGRIVLAKDRFLYYLKNRFIKNKGKAEQYSWKHLRGACSHLPDHYDSAIGFLEKTSNYFVIDCVKANSKLAFIHTTYSKLQLNHDFDVRYFNQFKKIALVSPECADDFRKTLPTLSNRVVVMPNIVSAKLIHSLSLKECDNPRENLIISVGRLEEVKGFDLAIKAAKILVERKITFHWSVIGEGSERYNLQTMIDSHGLSDYFTLIGLRDNPYPYMRSAKIFVQPSRYEGKSIAVDEAKILAKPIVLTNFSTAQDQINHNENGLIIDMTPEAIAGGIEKYLSDANFTEKIIANLRTQNFGTEDEINKFYQLINE